MDKEKYNKLGEEVSPVVESNDSTPAFVKYGAAVILGLAFGIGCYVWYSGGVPSAPQNPRHVEPVPTEEYFTITESYDAVPEGGIDPNPFESPYENPIVSSETDDNVLTVAEE